MENIIFYSLLLVCIILLFIVGYNFTKINKYKSNAQFWQESFNDVSKRVKELTTKNTDQAQLITKLTDELTIKNTTIESLTNHLKDKEKPFRVLDSLEDLIPRKIETKKTKKK